MTDPIKLTVDAALEVDGREDTVQLAVQGHSTQNEALQSWEDESGTPVAQMQGDGRLEVNLLDLDEQGSTPGNPASGQVRLYAKDDGKVYAKDSAGVEHDLTAGNGGGSANEHLLIGEKSEDNDLYSSGWNTRVLTDIIYDETEGASLNSGAFTLPAGTYVYRAVAQAYGAANAVMLRLYNVTDAQAEPGQHRVQAWGADAASWVNVFVWGRFTISESTTFRLEQYHGTSSGYGRTQINVPSEMEYHAFIELERQESGSQGATVLDDLSDVDAASPTDGDVLTYDDSSGDWVAQAPSGGAGAPTGAMFHWPTDTPPSGYLLCYGQAVSRTTYADLFGVIGETFGVGDGSTTFNLPDLRGRFPLGQDDMGGSSANRVTASEADSVGGANGAETHTLTATEMPVHSHSTIEGNNLGGGYYFGGNAVYQFNAYTATTTAGSGGAHNNMPPYLTLNYIIKT